MHKWQKRSIGIESVRAAARSCRLASYELSTIMALTGTARVGVGASVLIAVMWTSRKALRYMSLRTRTRTSILRANMGIVYGDRGIMGDVIDKRPMAAIYGTTASKRDMQAVELWCAFCAANGLHGVLFLDKRIGKTEHPPAWSKLCTEVSKGKFQLVITGLDLNVPAMESWCAQYGVKFERIDIFEWADSGMARANLAPGQLTTTDSR